MQASMNHTHISSTSCSLEGNNVGPEGAKALAEALKVNTALATLT